MPGYLRQPSGRGWALVGDAGYMSDPITAHGITNALRDAALLSKAIVDGNALERFREARDELSTTFFHLSDRIASCEWDVPTLQQYHRAMNEEMRREEAFLLSTLGPVLEEAPMNRVNRYEAAI
jgi:flavin-dependent dehydrogenase